MGVPERFEKAGTEMSATIDEAPPTTATQEAALPQPSARLFWKAVIRVGARFGATREGDRVEWHLSGCAAPEGGEHCSEGQRLLDLNGQPDGHCVINGVCGRCAADGTLDLARAA